MIARRRKQKTEVKKSRPRFPLLLAAAQHLLPAFPHAGWSNSALIRSEEPATLGADRSVPLTECRVSSSAAASNTLSALARVQHWVLMKCEIDGDLLFDQRDSVLPAPPLLTVNACSSGIVRPRRRPFNEELTADFRCPRSRSLCSGGGASGASNATAPAAETPAAAVNRLVSRALLGQCKAAAKYTNLALIKRAAPYLRATIEQRVKFLLRVFERWQDLGPREELVPRYSFQLEVSEVQGKRLADVYGVEVIEPFASSTVWRPPLQSYELPATVGEKLLLDQLAISTAQHIVKRTFQSASASLLQKKGSLFRSSNLSLAKKIRRGDKAARALCRLMGCVLRFPDAVATNEHSLAVTVGNSELRVALFFAPLYGVDAPGV